MQVYEFSTVINDGGIIHVPSQYLQHISSPVKVILQTEDKKTNTVSKKFSAIKLKTKGFKFDRNVADER
ncbi:MAG: hypothetical protein LBP87_15820 [Planctomycetaceae bacterium]|jgi:hypothetical protein|nr:hypothetical protein [Planctomycetaceae bacterium]